MSLANKRGRWLLSLILFVWGLQLCWLVWHFGPEGRDLALRLKEQRVGSDLRQEDPFYRWLQVLSATLPPEATYLFLDGYEAGKEIEARYHLYPRRHILLSPQIPPSFLFHAAVKEEATFLIVREGAKPLGPGARAALDSPACHALDLPGPGLVFRVDYTRLQGGFYD